MKKSIAAALLLVMLAWTEVNYVPVLIMHAWHATAMNARVEQPAYRDHVLPADPADHSCCPKIGEPMIPAPVALAATSLPCQNEHRCCLLRGAPNPPAPVSSHRDSPRMVAANAFSSDPPQASSALAERRVLSRHGPPGNLSMVLRI